MSGVKVHDTVKALYDNMKTLPTGDRSGCVRLAVFKIDGDSIAVKETLTNKQLEGLDVYEVAKERLRDKECCYILYDCHFKCKETSEKNELVFMTWCPDSANIKAKMVYSSSKTALKKALSDVKHDIQLNDLTDFDRESFLERITKDKVETLEGKDLCGHSQQKHGHGHGRDRDRD